MHDLKILRRYGLLKRLLPGECGLADKGYVARDISHIIKTPIKGSNLSEAAKLWNRSVAAIRITVERVNGLIKGFAILSHAFRHNIALHGIVFQVVCQLVNLRMELFPLVRKVHPLLLGQPVRFKMS